MTLVVAIACLIIGAWLGWKFKPEPPPPPYVALQSGGADVVRGTGLEPARLSALAPKASASANSAIPALCDFALPPAKSIVNLSSEDFSFCGRVYVLWGFFERCIWLPTDKLKAVLAASAEIYDKMPTGFRGLFAAHISLMVSLLGRSLGLFKASSSRIADSLTSRSA
jgi:hypothetical protein